MATATSAVQLDIHEFNHAFLPSTDDAIPSPCTWDHNLFSSMRRAKSVKGNDISELLVTAINDNELTPGSICSRYTPYFEPTVDKTSLDDSTAIFRTAHVPSEGQPRWSDLSVPIEVYTHRHAIDPFDYTDSQDLDANEKSRNRILERISTVADLLFAAQHRVFLFMILIIGRRFRFLRLDRAGIITTPSVDYYEDPHVLCDILWRVSQLDDMALGFDPTATRILPGDVDFSRMDFLAISNPSDLDDTERVQVRDGRTTRHYLIGKPSFRSGEFLGRGTCGYVAYDCERHNFVWLKDAWRASYMLAKTEGDVLGRINSAGVSNVPTLVCDGDVGGQSTITADWWERKRCDPSTSLRPPPSSSSRSSSTTLASSSSPGSKKRKRVAHMETAIPMPPYSPNATLHSNCPLRQHVHYRIVVEEVCMPLKHFEHGRQLVSVVLDCLLGKYGGNIMILPKIKRDKNGNNPMVVWTGVLSDWELSRPVDAQDAASKQTQTDRMGTYQFMSANLLNHITKPVKVSDELESFFHLLVYYAVRYLSSNCTNVSSWIDSYFYNYSGPERMHTCGMKSLAVEETGLLEIDSPVEGPLLFDSPMDGALSTILKTLRAHYKVMNHDAVTAAPNSCLCPETLPESPLLAPAFIMLDFDDDVDADLDPEEVARWEARLHMPLPDHNTPTPEDRELARKVADHTFMIAHLARVLRDPRWGADDRRNASAPAPAPSPQHPDGSGKPGARPPSEAARTPSIKRQRTSGPERNVSLPARLRASTRRVRTNARTHPIRARR
ncbi:hypothetical protein GSI_05185 [Ganoderma sinense ZZ0214-1]|uniref:Fungal-type protein kinase domain-containing protein n=1 Tax=Ganoderma sinense ZZ0214-1 TaxID=1077348 RepID=A0A2G8SFE1_9APHY|nr:hypothetical protein GSI_05185 [Ganoderma sinense ZZ0214-1]